jgi:ATP synthase protein I
MKKAPDDSDEVIAGLRRDRERHRRWLRDGDPSLGQQFARVGVLGWMIVTPLLLGVWLGRRLDAHFDSGIFWTSPLLLLGLAVGCWSAWKWMHAP